MTNLTNSVTINGFVEHRFVINLVVFRHTAINNMEVEWSTASRSSTLNKPAENPAEVEGRQRGLHSILRRLWPFRPTNGREIGSATIQVRKACAFYQCRYHTGTNWGIWTGASNQPWPRSNSDMVYTPVLHNHSSPYRNHILHDPAAMK